MRIVKVLTTSLCYPTPSQPDQGVFVHRRASALAQRGDTDVRVVSPIPWCPVIRPKSITASPDAPLPVSYPRMFSVPVLGWGLDGVAYGEALLRTARRMNENGAWPIDLIDAHFVYPDGVGALLAARRLGVPVSVTVRGKIVSLSQRTIRRMQIRSMLRGVDARIAVSQSLADWVHQIAGSDVSVDVIPNGIDPVTFHAVDREHARSIVGWKPGQRICLAVGHLQHLKGFDRIVSILPTVRETVGDVRLVLVGSRRGEPRFQRDLLAMVDACNRAAGTAEPVVQFVGPVAPSALNLMYNAADVTINASRSEGWCNAIGEALATGTPVVATDVGGNREQIHSSHLGYVVPDGDEAALARATVTALSRSWDRGGIAEQGVQRTWATVGHDVRQVFERVLAPRAGQTVDAKAGDRPSEAVALPRPGGGS